VQDLGVRLNQRTVIESTSFEVHCGEIYVDTVNGVADHIHLLVGLRPAISPSKAVNLLKWLSSHWINSNDFIVQKFAWQEGFGVASVSHSGVQKLRDYISNQEEHHRTLTYEEEIQRFLKAFEIDMVDKDDEE
jgi:REP element-mobilizing transposase RayT